MNRPVISPPLHLTPFQQEVLNGLMLGDGNLHKHTKLDKATLSVTRQLKDLAYLKENYETFKEFCGSPPVEYRETLDKRTNKTYYSCKFSTIGCDVFHDTYVQWYGTGIKIIPQNLSLTPVVCAIWFCDDGCVTVSKKCNSLRLKLATHGFSKQENEQLINKLSELLQSYFSLASENDKVYITASTQGTCKFIKFIEPHIPMSMARKIKWTPTSLLNTGKPQIKNRNEADLNSTELELLKSFCDAIPKTQSEVAHELNWLTGVNSSPATCINRYVQKFSKKNWIAQVDLNAKKLKSFILTDKGKEILNQNGIKLGKTKSKEEIIIYSLSKRELEILLVLQDEKKYSSTEIEKFFSENAKCSKGVRTAINILIKNELVKLTGQFKLCKYSLTSLGLEVRQFLKTKDCKENEGLS